MNTQSTLLEYEGLMNQMKDNITQLSNDIAIKGNKKKTSLNKEEMIKKEMEDVYNDHLILQKENKQIDNELTELLKEKEGLIAKIEYLEKEYHNATNKIKQYEDCLSAKDNLIIKLKKSKESGESNQAVDYKEMYQQITKTNNELSENCKEVNGKIQDLINSREPMKQEYEQTIDSMKELLNDSSVQRSEMDKIIKENEELKVIHHDLLKKIESLPDLANTFSTLVEENKLLRSQYNEIYEKEQQEKQNEENRQREIEDSKSK